MDTSTFKTSTIFISTGEQTLVYRSIGDMPAELRRKLAKSTAGENAATILIADKRGRQELVRAIQGEPASIALRVTEQARRRREYRARMERARARRYWLEILLILVLGGILWSLAVWR